MAVATSDDDGFREIQLNGKQLVFLFMAVTVVLVVTFLTGVLVGRGVRTERAEAAQADALTDAPPTPARAETPNAPAEDPRTATPPPEAVEDVEPPVAAPRNPEPAAEVRPPEAPAVAATKAPAAAATAGKAAAAPAKAPAAAPARTAERAPAAAPPAATAAASAPPSGPRNGYAVQVAAVNVRADADSIVRRLSAKGYSAYVEVPKNSTSVFRVRVGTFRTRREAQSMAERLKKEEKFNPWVTR